MGEGSKVGGYQGLGARGAGMAEGQYIQGAVRERSDTGRCPHSLDARPPHAHAPPTPTPPWHTPPAAGAVTGLGDNEIFNGMLRTEGLMEAMRLICGL